MPDLLVQAHPGPPSRLKAANISSRLQAKPGLGKTPAPPTPERAITGTISRTIREANDLWLWCKDGMTRQQRELFQQHENRRQSLCLRMKDALTLKQWEDAARELDALEGNDEWKQDAMTGDYNAALLEQRLRQLDEARASCDIRSMMHLIRTALSRDLAGMGNVDLYRHSYVGTKKLIERYVESTIETINAVVSQSSLAHGIDHRDLLEGMLYSRQSFGRSALLLSGGGTFGMTHIGVAKALFEANLLPRIISGASAGSIVSAVLCCKADDEVPGMLREFPYGDLAVFESQDNKDGVLDHLRRLLTEGSWSDIKHLTRVMRELTEDITFQEAYNRTRRVLNICVSTESIYELPTLLNYVTAPNVMIWSAVAASCSVPLIFNASPLLVKDPVTGEHKPWNPTPHHFIDGSVDNDLPMTRLSEMFNVNHFIVSQVNPHVVPFLDKNDHLSPDQAEREKASHGDELDWTYALTSMAKEEALHRLHFMAEMGFMPNLATKFRSILSQKYSGDITILPQISVQDLPKVLQNPTPDFMIRSCLLGERATWPKLSRIRDQCAIELALDRAVHSLRTRVVFSESQRDLRKLGTSSFSSARLRLQSSISTLKLHQSVPEDSEPRVTRRNRTRSGGSLLPPDPRMLIGDDLTDDETADEERRELITRCERAGSVNSGRKPRLKRASKSHLHIPQRPSTAISLTGGHSEKRDFDFSKPLTPPSERRRNHGNLLDSESQSTAVEEHDFLSPNTWSSSRDTIVGQATSPLEDIETSAQDDHSSEADVEQGTEESDLEPFDGPHGNTQLFKPMDRMDACVKPVGVVSGSLWD
ncbi:acyl transferase/acyl hydrolase/lysophospholipase [Stachybotrys elegans]|uniref:Patatin-like phospholipase domain-containing protein n=1 Tax=Stachybotrys elegans TaxID=80388 RepID=A0A8K0SWS3_9HYPO|nr:acyl transferase/acyl hydrolase/lysophospholipase [Stachybotrys elegans]